MPDMATGPRAGEETAKLSPRPGEDSAVRLGEWGSDLGSTAKEIQMQKKEKKKLHADVVWAKRREP